MIAGIDSVLVVYILIGLVHSITTVSIISYYDNAEDNDATTYFMAGCIGVTLTFGWIVTMPIVFFSVLAWYVSENLGRK